MINNQLNKQYAQKRLNKILTIKPKERDWYIRLCEEKLNRLSKQKLSSVTYICKCEYCLSNKTISSQRKELAAKDQIKEFVTYE